MHVQININNFDEENCKRHGSVIPECFCRGSRVLDWIPAFAGMTKC